MSYSIALLMISQRVSAAELLKHKFLKGRTKDALVHQLLDQIPMVFFSF